jgi:uncharacterized phage-associated protein
MLISRQREKLLNSIIYFAKNTSQCGKTKLFKLLYFLDFEHFRQTGRSVTGLEYHAYPMGPLPESLNSEIDDPEEEFEERIRFVPTITSNNRVMYRPESKGGFDSSHFSKREMGLLIQLAEEYRDSSAGDMVEKTHIPNSPWHQLYEVEGKRQHAIPYEYAFEDNIVPEDIRERVGDREEFIRNYS